MFVRPDASIDGSVVAVVSDTSYVSRPDPQSLFTPMSSRPKWRDPVRCASDGIFRLRSR